MADLNSIFQNLAFPVAVCCILFYLLAISLKKENFDSIEKKFQEINRCSDAKEV